MMQQCLTCSRRNIPPEQVSCPACGSVDLRGYDPAASVERRQTEHDRPDEAFDDGGEGENLEVMREIDERSRRP